MIDVFFIVFTGGMAVYIIVRAAMLDRVEPWYEVIPEQPISPPRASVDRGPARRVVAGRDLAPRKADTTVLPGSGG
jgi:hypothetical protein